MEEVSNESDDSREGVVAEDGGAEEEVDADPGKTTEGAPDEVRDGGSRSAPEGIDPGSDGLRDGFEREERDRGRPGTSVGAGAGTGPVMVGREAAEGMSYGAGVGVREAVVVGGESGDMV